MSDAFPIAALIVAAGRGQRAGDGVPKQYRPLPGGYGQSVLAETLAIFARHKRVQQLCVVLHKDDVSLYNTSINSLENNDKIIYELGGDTRQKSVLNGLKKLADTAPAQVLIHDAARPFVSTAEIDACLDALTNHDGAIVALPVTDTLKRGANGLIDTTVPRDGLYRAQTPQAFHFDKILAAHQSQSGLDLTDDAAIAEAAGLRVALLDGAAQNIKLTFEDDFVTQTLIPRTGTGFDVHRFGPPNSATQIMLGGISVPHDRILVGHSDADVALHAITDALLGALAAGDIGDHFPPSDAANKDRPSADFLTHAVALANERRARISHIDLTLICEAPKIGPHKLLMRERIAALCAVPVGSISVKATTTEGLGFTGRGDGMAAQAVVTLMEPSI